MTSLTPKQEKFCMAYVETSNASEAYRRAYNAGKMTANAIGVAANELMNNPKVTIKVRELRDSLLKQHQITVNDLVAELEEARVAALTAETVQSSAATAATMGKAKLLGLDKQIIEQTVTQTTEIKGELRLVAGLADKLGAIKGKK